MIMITNDILPQIHPCSTIQYHIIETSSFARNEVNTPSLVTPYFFFVAMGRTVFFPLSGVSEIIRNLSWDIDEKEWEMK